MKTAGSDNFLKFVNRIKKNIDPPQKLNNHSLMQIALTPTCHKSSQQFVSCKNLQYYQKGNNSDIYKKKKITTKFLHKEG